MEIHRIDTLRVCFLKFIAEGMTHEEALREFDEKEWDAAMMLAVTFIDFRGLSLSRIAGLATK